MEALRNNKFKNAGASFLKLAVMTLVAFFAMGAVLQTTAQTKVGKKGYYPAGSPTRAIQDLDDMLDDFAIAPKGGKLSESQEEHNRKIKQNIIHGTFDIRELSKLSLGKHWSKRTPTEQDEFVTLLTNLLEEKALFSKEQSAAKSKSGGKYYVNYTGHKFLNKDKTKAYVRTKVVVPSENIDITLNYKLKRKDGGWKIYDVIVDEASLVDNYKYQFNKIIVRDGYQDLVNRMSKKLSQIRRDREERNGVSAQSADKKS
jgi:phospholipid transport system substrate-binding protein